LGFRARQTPLDSSGLALRRILDGIVPVMLVGADEPDGGALECVGLVQPNLGGLPSMVQLWPGEHDLWVERIFVWADAATEWFIKLERPAFGINAPPSPAVPMRGGTTVGLRGLNAGLATGPYVASVEGGGTGAWIECGHLLVPALPHRPNTNTYRPPAQYLAVWTEASNITASVAFWFREAP
jgi:hypothetical protein